MDQLSRLSGDIGDTDTIVKQLKFLGIRIIAVQEGIDPAEETAKLCIVLGAFKNGPRLTLFDDSGKRMWSQP